MPTLAQTYKRPADEIRPEDLSHVEGEGNYSRLHFVDASSVLFSRSLKVFAVRYPWLMRISKEVLVNPGRITDWRWVNTRTMWVVVAGVSYWVARRRIEEVTKRLLESQS